MEQARLDLSVVIITFNEQDNISRCIGSLPQGAEVIVLDSHSTDQTTEIALSLGAKVYQNRFETYSKQKNLACSYATRSWILSIDADEQLDEGLRRSLEQIHVEGAVHEPGLLAYRVKRKLVFMGKVMSHGRSTDYPIRLFKKGSCSFVGAIHERLDVPAAQIGKWRAGTLYHYSYKDLTDYFNRFNKYTTSIAMEHFIAGKSFRLAAHLLRPWFEFFYRYVIRLGFLDGYAGYTYALVSSLYTYMKYAKLYELRSDVNK
jgi:glycosyltransferase involved in cell wall biosynthesis